MYESKFVALKRVEFVIRQGGNLLSVDTDFAQRAGHWKVRTASIKSASTIQGGSPHPGGHRSIFMTS